MVKEMIQEGLGEKDELSTVLSQRRDKARAGVYSYEIHARTNIRGWQVSNQIKC